MGKCFDRFIPKGFSVYSFTLHILYSLLAVAAIIISSRLPSSPNLQCDVNDAKISKVMALIKCIEEVCSFEYQHKFDLILGMNFILILNFVSVFVLSIFSVFVLNSRVKKFDYQTGTADEENRDKWPPPPNTGQNPREFRKCLGHFSTLCIYIVHLFLFRIIPLLGFAILLFYRTPVPNNFFCSWSTIQYKGTCNFNDTIHPRLDLANIDCTNPVGAKSRALVQAVVKANVMFATLAFFEFFYILWFSFNDRNFMTDQEFCTVYLLRKRKIIRKLINKIRKGFNQELLIRDHVGASIEISLIYDVNAVIQEGREQMNAYPKEFGSHLETPSTDTKLMNTADIFKPGKGEQNQKYPRTILVIGRPGVGKTVLTLKLLHQWKVEADNFWREKVVILLQFRTFNNETVTLREMLSKGHGFSQDNFEDMYNLIWSNPTNTVLIFDGLDELPADSNSFCSSSKTVMMPNEKRHVFSIFQMLVNGRLLPGVTVLTTSRPKPEVQEFLQNLKFNKTVEILGFFEEQIQRYVVKFCQNNNNARIYNLIKGSVELLSLCYTPGNCYIICSVLKESIENGEQKEHVPKTLTELYKRPVEALLKSPQPNLKSKSVQFTKLKEFARSGISEGRLISERTTDDESGDLANYSLFHKLPPISFTLQEFLTALHVVDDMESVDQFLETHVDDPKWHLVIQFVAGLVGDKMREAKKAADSTASPKESKSQKTISHIQKRLENWVYSLGDKENQIALLGIKCLYELQEIGIVESVSSNLVTQLGDEDLRLENLNITPVYSATLFEFLSVNENLKRIQFHHCQIQGKSTYQNIEKLLLNNAITSFSWIEGVTNEGIEYLSSAMGGRYCKLAELDLKDNKITDQALGYLSNALKDGNCKLTKLVLKSTSIGDEGVVEYLSKGLKSKNCKLTKLHLENTKIGDKGVTFLCDAIESSNCKLTELGLNGSLITHQAVESLSLVLKSSNLKVAKLFLDNTKIGDEGVKYLCDAMKSATCKLNELSLNGCSITHQSIPYLTEALKGLNCKINKLHLDNTKIGDEGIGCLGVAIESRNSKLSELTLRENYVF